MDQPSSKRINPRLIAISLPAEFILISVDTHLPHLTIQNQKPVKVDAAKSINPKIRRGISMKARNPRCWFIFSLIAGTLLSLCRPTGFVATAHSAQKELQKLTVGYTPIAGASLPFFIAVEERIFQKYGFEILPVFMSTLRTVLCSDLDRSTAPQP